MNFKKAVILLAAAFNLNACCDDDRINDGVGVGPSPIPPVEENPGNTNPVSNVPADTLKIFVQDLRLTEEPVSGVDFRVTPHVVDQAVPQNLWLSATVAPQSLATHQLTVERIFTLFATAQNVTPAGNFHNGWDGTDSNLHLQNYDKHHYYIHNYFSRKDHGVVAEVIKPNPATGVNDTLRPTVIDLWVANVVDYVTTPRNGQNPLNPGLGFTTPLQVDPGKKMTYNGATIKLTP